MFEKLQKPQNNLGLCCEHCTCQSRLVFDTVHVAALLSRRLSQLIKRRRQSSPNIWQSGDYRFYQGAAFIRQVSVPGGLGLSIQKHFFQIGAILKQEAVPGQLRREVHPPLSLSSVRGVGVRVCDIQLTCQKYVCTVLAQCPRRGGGP